MLGKIQLIEVDNAMVMGFIEVINMKGIGAGHIFRLHTVLLKKLTVIGNKVWPYRPKGFHFVDID